MKSKTAFVNLMKIGAFVLIALSSCKKEKEPTIFKTTQFEGNYACTKKGNFVYLGIVKVDTPVSIRITAVSDSTINIQEGGSILKSGVVIDESGNFGKSGADCKVDASGLSVSSFCGNISNGKLSIEELFDAGTTPSFGWNYFWECNK